MAMAQRDAGQDGVDESDGTTRNGASSVCSGGYSEQLLQETWNGD